jgi:hypothetical protein
MDGTGTKISPSSPTSSARRSRSARGDDPELASYLRIEERELEGGRAELKARGVQEATPLASE